jgi:hypothetical protein
MASKATERRIMTEQLCHVGRVTDNPCPNIAVTETDFGSPVCETHEAIIDLGAVADGYTLVGELLEEAMEKAKALHAGQEAVMLLERARDEAQQESRRVSQEMDALKPERGF